jgi:alpha-beta hydrolase superfamily lysophospholipase
MCATTSGFRWPTGTTRSRSPSFAPRPGPFGAIILNHGVGEGVRERFLESPTLFIQAASAFVSRGYAVVLPLRRGFGETGGAFAEDAAECGSPH